MKTLLAIASIALLASPAVAGKHRLGPSKAKPTAVAKKGLGAVVETKAENESQIVLVKEAEVNFNFGDDYVMRKAGSSRESARPDVDEETFQAKAVSNKEAVNVVKSKADELEYCWSRVPAAKRVDTSGVLHIAIEASGAVAGVWIDGAVPASVEKCMSDRAAKWTFPAADAGCELEHGISFSTLESKGTKE